MRPTLERLGLLEFFIAMVTAEDGMETKSQRFLSAAIKMGRPPNHCVVFDSCLAGITAAHNCTMKVALSKPHILLLSSCQASHTLDVRWPVTNKKALHLQIAAFIATQRYVSVQHDLCALACISHAQAGLCVK